MRVPEYAIPRHNEGVAEFEILSGVQCRDPAVVGKFQVRGEICLRNDELL